MRLKRFNRNSHLFRDHLVEEPQGTVYWFAITSTRKEREVLDACCLRITWQYKAFQLSHYQSKKYITFTPIIPFFLSADQSRNAQLLYQKLNPLLEKTFLVFLAVLLNGKFTTHSLPISRLPIIILNLSSWFLTLSKTEFIERELALMSTFLKSIDITP